MKKFKVTGIIFIGLTSGCIASEEAQNLRSFKDCAECPEMVVLPKGKYIMGALEGYKNVRPFYLPPHEVTIDYHLAVGKFEITRGNFYQCYIEGGCKEMPDVSPIFARAGVKVQVPDQTGSMLPMNFVTWDMTQQYIEWLSEKTGREYRLLSESEWEYASRAGSTTEYFWGDEIDPRYVKYRANSRNLQRDPVDQVLPNNFGVYGTLGGVTEWTSDCKYTNVEGMPTDGSARVDKADCSFRVLRGGSFPKSANSVTISRRSFRVIESTNAKDEYGFRVATAEIEEN